MSLPFLSVIVPAYRQAKTINDELRQLHTTLQVIVPSHEIILVIDGDEDHTASIIQSLAIPDLKVQCFPTNQGKGLALRHGLALARGELVAYVDAGGDLAPESLAVMLAELKLHQADIVIGSKRHSLSEVSYPLLRRLYSLTYQLINRVLFQLKIRDTQVGLKLLRREVLIAVLPRILVKQFAFDLELLVVANHLGFRRIVEAPIKLNYNFSSTISLLAIWQTLWDTFAIFYRLRLLHWYDRPPLPAKAVVTSPLAITIHPAPPHREVEMPIMAAENNPTIFS